MRTPAIRRAVSRAPAVVLVLAGVALAAAVLLAVPVPARAADETCPGSSGHLPPSVGEVVGAAFPTLPLPRGWSVGAGRVEACAVVVDLQGPKGVRATLRLGVPGSPGAAAAGRHFAVAVEAPPADVPVLARAGLALDAAFTRSPWVRPAPPASPPPAIPRDERPTYPAWAGLLLGVLLLALLAGATVRGVWRSGTIDR